VEGGGEAADGGGEQEDPGVCGGAGAARRGAQGEQAGEGGVGERSAGEALRPDRERGQVQRGNGKGICDLLLFLQ